MATVSVKSVERGIARNLSLPFVDSENYFQIHPYNVVFAVGLEMGTRVGGGVLPIIIIIITKKQ